ncbi:MAG TPA: hypothetical protein VFV38_38595, partial [Ktedonobacteraceae bacterium]|nr:hypothetical protein [Ktedonobacteraceae bacterium]
ADIHARAIFHAETGLGNHIGHRSSLLSGFAEWSGAYLRWVMERTRALFSFHCSPQQASPTR